MISIQCYYLDSLFYGFFYIIVFYLFCKELIALSFKEFRGKKSQIFRKTNAITCLFQIFFYRWHHFMAFINQQSLKLYIDDCRGESS